MELSNSLDVALTNDHGKYLSVPLLHSKVKKQTYSHVIDKVKALLSNWKASSLSLAGRLTLINSILMSIPNYTM